MSDDNETTLPPQDELTTLKARADLLGVTYHPSIGLDKLREKVSAALSGEAPTPITKPTVAEEETEGQLRARMRREATALVRIRITCMNPAKKDWEGEVITAGNSLVGTFKKYVPFNADAGWHVPTVIYQLLKDRQCQVFVTVKSARGVDVRKGKLIKEFAIEVLDPLTQEELAELAQRQALARSID